ncbi:hypothetical protein [Microtetraspora fusca]|uniref:hypothetical protein n=1 Tax=Microtetraspora fusca TaxID=1997 RepID=UPI000B11221D|nr:hypothetical protein [Microtetraspora fusca]
MLKNAFATGALVASALVLPVTFSALPANATAASQGEGSGATTTKAADCWWSNGCKYCRSHGETRRVTCEHRRGREPRAREPRVREPRERYEHGRYPERYYEHPGRYEHRGSEQWRHERGWSHEQRSHR